MTEIEQNFKEFCERNGLRSRGLTVQKYRTDNNFWKSVDHIMDELKNDHDCGNLEELEVDIDTWFHHSFQSPPNELVITEDMFDSVTETLSDDVSPMWFDEIDGGYYSAALDGRTVGELREWAPVDAIKASGREKVLSDLESWWEQSDFNDLIKVDGVNDAIGYEYPEDEFSEVNFIDEVMAIWEIYFTPVSSWDNVDETLAWKAGLYPFTYKGEQYVALGGCGMDLSPKLDAYQVLTRGTLPTDSKAFSDTMYFDYVAGIKTEEALKLCELDDPVYRFAAVKANIDKE